jgi:hypothetical protein
MNLRQPCRSVSKARSRIFFRVITPITPSQQQKSSRSWRCRAQKDTQTVPTPHWPHRTYAIDGVLEHSPAKHARRPAVPAESPTSGFTRLQLEPLLTAARQSPRPCDFALAAMLGLAKARGR